MSDRNMGGNTVGTMGGTIGMRRIRPYYPSVTGVITGNQPFAGGRVQDPCVRMITVEDAEGNQTNFLVDGQTFIVDYVTLREGMPVTVFYDGNAPAPLIYPPQFRAFVVAGNRRGQMVSVAFFNSMLVAADRSLRLNIGPNTTVVTNNNQIFAGTPANRTLVVLYSRTTRSIPPQTTPERVIVLCGV